MSHKKIAEETFCIQCGRLTILDEDGYCKDCQLDHQVAAEEMNEPIDDGFDFDEGFNYEGDYDPY